MWVRSWISRLYDLVNCRLQNLQINCFLGRDVDVLDDAAVEGVAPDVDVEVDVDVDAACC